MIKYEKYKPSGLDWIGNIPELWEVKRIKDVFKNFGSGTTPSASNVTYYEDGNIPWLNTSDLNNDVVYDTKLKVTEKALKETGLKIYPKNSLTIAMYGQGKTRGKVGLINFDFTTNQASCVMYSPKNINLKYILYWFKYKYEDIRAINTGASQPNMNQDFVKLLQIHYPSLKEQIQISNYLDTKTLTIDKKINLLIQKTNYYKEYRKSIINEAVCKGLNKNVIFRNSDINYINDIPEHWRIERIKDLFNIGRGRVIGQELLVEEGKYPVYSSQTENNGCLGYIETYDFDNDLLTWTTDGANAGTVFRRSGKFNCTNVCGTLIPKRKNLDLDYVVYALQESATHNKRIDTNGAKIMNNEMAVINIAFPPLKEQTEIAKFLDDKTQTIDKIVENINTQISTLKELRKTLINDVVTGKIKVVE